MKVYNKQKGAGSRYIGENMNTIRICFIFDIFLLY